MSDWKEFRKPLDDERDEDARVASYWQWLAAQDVGTLPRGTQVDRFGSKTVVRLAGPKDADYEAAHMDHSIGHSWDKYSALGTIFSIRNADGRPEATFLVSGSKVVHARERFNARLSAGNRYVLSQMAFFYDWSVVEDRLPFDAFLDGHGPNTMVRYCARTVDNRIEKGEAVFAGAAVDAEIAALAASVDGAGGFDPSIIGLAEIEAGGRVAQHEIITVRHVEREPTEAASLGERLGAQRDTAALPQP
jgi:hypothetical protein